MLSTKVVPDDSIGAATNRRKWGPVLSWNFEEVAEYVILKELPSVRRNNREIGDRVRIHHYLFRSKTTSQEARRRWRIEGRGEDFKYHERRVVCVWSCSWVRSSCDEEDAKRARRKTINAVRRESEGSGCGRLSSTVYICSTMSTAIILLSGRL